MSTHWRAAFAVPVVSLALITTSVASASAEEQVNLIGTYGSIQNNAGQLGVIGVSAESMYLFNYTDLAIGESVSASEVDCGAAWDAKMILCDPAPTTDVSGSLSQTSVNSGYISSINGEDEVTTSYVVIDLGAERTFGSLEVFQMKQSDGAVTNAELFVSDELGDTWPSQTDASWSVVTGGAIADGPDQTGDGPVINTAVTQFSFESTSGRYVMVYFQNDGSYGVPDWIEVAGVKLFGTTTPAAVVPDAVLAETGLSTAVPLGALALLALVVGALMIAPARLRRASSAR